jgi:hypothetical protein
MAFIQSGMPVKSLGVNIAGCHPVQTHGFAAIAMLNFIWHDNQREQINGFMQKILQPADSFWPWRRAVQLASCCALLFFSSLTCSAQPAAGVAPADVEAAYLYNFGKFVDWPVQAESATQPFTICVLGKDEFGTTLDSLIANDSVKGRSIVAKRMASIAAADTCQIIYVGLSEQPHMAKDLDTLRDKPILTVSSLPEFLERGGIIQFVIEENKVRFAVNLASATRSHLALSSDLLKVAVYVDSKPSREGQ